MCTTQVTLTPASGIGQGKVDNIHRIFCTSLTTTTLPIPALLDRVDRSNIKNRKETNEWKLITNGYFGAEFAAAHRIMSNG